MRKSIFKLLAATLAVITLLALPVTALAFKPTGTTALTQPTAIPASSTLISKDLTASAKYSATEFKINTITDAADLADIADFKKYGVSMLGISGLERSLTGAVDGVWTGGNTGDTLTNGKKAQGAASFFWGSNTYNIKGETGKSDSVYPGFMTVNLGKLCTVDAFGFVTSGDNNNGIPQAADIYTSTDGETWTLAGYYDRPATRIAGGDLTYFAASGIGKDKLDKEGTGRVILFSLKNVKAQYLRLAFTAGAGKTTPADAAKYEDYYNADTASVAFRELLVYGAEAKTPETTKAPADTGKKPEDSAPGAGDPGNPATGDNTFAIIVLLEAVMIAGIVTVFAVRKNKATGR